MTDLNEQKTTELVAEYATPVRHEISAFAGDMQTFENAQRIAKALSSSTLVPQDYKGNVANCMLAIEMSQRVNANPLAVMQNLYIIHGRPSWSSQFTIAALNGCGRFSPLRFEMVGGPQNEDKWGCKAYAIELATGERLDGPWVSIKMAKAEGWYSKKGSKWVTMPDLMLRYRAAKFFGNLYAPDLLMGMSTDDEVNDFSGQNGSAQPQKRQRTGFVPPQRNEVKQEEKPVEKDITPHPEDVPADDLKDPFDIGE